MIKRHGNAKPIPIREAHPLADPVTVVENVVVGEHRALREAGRPGRVLDVDDVVEFERGLAPGELSGRNAFGEPEQLSPGQHAGLPVAWSSPTLFPSGRERDGVKGA